MSEVPALITHRDEQVEAVEILESDAEIGNDNDNFELDMVCESEDIDESVDMQIVS